MTKHQAPQFFYLPSTFKLNDGPNFVNPRSSRTSNRGDLSGLLVFKAAN